jgi:putative peptidoglycan lipid II flippase
MRREISRTDGRRLAEALLRIGLAAVGTSLLGADDGTLRYALTLGVVGAASLAAYLLAALLLRVEELRSAITVLRRRSPSEARARE